MSMSLLSWRRQLADVYAGVRASVEPEQGWALWRAGRERLFAEHPDSPLEPPASAGFAGLPFGTYDESLRFEAVVDADVEPWHLEIPTGNEEPVRMDRIGRITLGELGRLDVWWLAQYGGGLFLPLRDGSAGSGTYGAGRYLLDTAKGADLGSSGGRSGAIIVDLNFAYHPSCAYSPRWVCPLAQEGNRIEAVIEAGERYPDGGWPLGEPVES